MQTELIYKRLCKNLSDGDCTQICHNYDCKNPQTLQYALKCIILHITSVWTDNVASKMRSSLAVLPVYISYPSVLISQLSGPVNKYCIIWNSVPCRYPRFTSIYCRNWTFFLFLFSPSPCSLCVLYLLDLTLVLSRSSAGLKDPKCHLLQEKKNLSYMFIP